MKKIIACLMAFIIIISLCACGNNETAEQSSTGDGIIGEAMTAISSAEATMPILTASGRMSSNTASICCCKNSGVDS